MKTTSLVVETRSGAALILEEGQNLTVVDVEGMQAADLVAFARPACGLT